MFEFIRSHQRLMQLFLLLLIIPSFAFVGLEGYSRFRNIDNAVAKVAGKSITQQDWEAAQRDQMNRFRQMFGSKFDPKMFDTAEARQSVFDNLISERALHAEASGSHLTVTDQTLQQSILGVPGLTLPDGKFDLERYKSLLAAQQMTPAMFEARQRQDMVMQQLNSSIQATAFVPKSLAARLSEINEQEREVQEFPLKAEEKMALVKITDEMLKAYYNKNIAQFEIPEQVKAEYVVMTNENVLAQIEVKDVDAKSYYEKNLQRFSVDEQRRASHILISAKKEATATDKAAAKSKAEKLLEQVRKNPGDFAKLAKENSQDPGSAERGGDLDFFGKGMMVKPFEEATYKLKKGEISDLVQSDFGFHIIQLTDIRPGSVKTFEDAKGEIVTEIRSQMLPKKFSELAEIFTNTAYEQADSLKPLADKLKLKIETVSNVSRQGNPMAGKNAPFNNPKFLKALFTDETIKNKRNTEAVEVVPGTLIAAHVVEHKPSAKRPFDDVKPMIVAAVTHIEAAKLVTQEGLAKLAALRAKDDASGFSAPKMVSRSKVEGLSGDALTAVMRVDTSKLPAYVGVETPGQGYSVFRVTKIAQPLVSDAARRTSEQQQATSNLAQQEMYSYIEFLKQKAKVQIFKQVALAVDKDGKELPESDKK